MKRLGGVLRLVAVTAAGAGLVAGVSRLPLPDVDLSGGERAVATTPHAVPLRARQLACPGPETVGVRGSTVREVLPAAAALTAAAPPASVPGAAPPAATPRPGRIALGSLPGMTTSGARVARSATVPSSGTPGRRSATLRAPAGVVLSGTGGYAPALTGEQTTLVTGGDLRGLTSVTCSAPATDTWLVGGAGEPGRRGRLVLTNPAATPVQVQVDVLGVRGTVERAAGSSVAVAGRARTVLALDALAPGVAAPVVHVTATGGAVSAVLHDARLDGTTPAGTDDVTAAAAPATDVVVPGVTVNGRVMLRIGVPGSTEAVVQVRLVGPRGLVDPPTGGAVRVRGGGSREIDLTGVPAGAYGVRLRADVPVVAGAMVERAGPGGRGADVAWLAGARPLRGVTGLAAVASTAPWSTTLELTAPAAAARVELVTVARDGLASARTLRVPAGRTTVTVLPASQSAWLRPAAGSGDVVAARTTTYLDRSRLITAAALVDLPTAEVEPALRPAP